MFPSISHLFLHWRGRQKSIARVEAMAGFLPLDLPLYKSVNSVSIVSRHLRASKPIDVENKTFWFSLFICIAYEQHSI